MISDKFFDQIEQEIIHLQERLFALQGENEDLRRELSSLRNGQNILIEIQGQRFAFSYSADDPATPLPIGRSEQKAPIPVAAAKLTHPIDTPLPALNVKVTLDYEATPRVKVTKTTPLVETHTDYTPAVETLATYGTTPVMKETSAEEGLDEKPEDEEKKEIQVPIQVKSQPSFLEEIMLDEFAAAATSPMAVWTGPIPKQKPINEDEKAALRKELMGSFLLE